jgi:hypothetical protein
LYPKIHAVPAATVWIDNKWKEKLKPEFVVSTTSQFVCCVLDGVAAVFQRYQNHSWEVLTTLEVPMMHVNCSSYDANSNIV